MIDPRQDRVDLPEPPVIDDGERVQVKLVELVEIERLTVPVNPLIGVTVMVELPGALESTEMLFGLGDIVKSF